MPLYHHAVDGSSILTSRSGSWETLSPPHADPDRGRRSNYHGDIRTSIGSARVEQRGSTATETACFLDQYQVPSVRWHIGCHNWVNPSEGLGEGIYADIYLYLVAWFIHLLATNPKLIDKWDEPGAQLTRWTPVFVCYCRNICKLRKSDFLARRSFLSFYTLARPVRWPAG